MTEPRRPSRRSFLRHGLTAGAALAGVGGWPRPAAPQGSRPTIPFGVQSGEVTASSAVIWSGADRPARMVVEWATNDRFTAARRVAGAAALPESGCTAKTVLDRLPSSQDVFYRVTFVDLRDRRRSVVAGRRPLAHGAVRRGRRHLRVVGRYRRAGLGHQRRVGRTASLRRHARDGPGFLRALRRSRLRRQPAAGRSAAGRRWRLEEPRDAGEGEGGGDAGRVPRPVPLQPDGRDAAPVQRRGRAVRAVGRPRRDRQLVPGPDPRRRALHGEELCAARGAGAAGDVRVDADRRNRRRAGVSRRSSAGRCWISSCSTCAATGGRTATIARRR